MPTLITKTPPQMEELVALAIEVSASAPAPARATLTARQAARVLTGVAGWLSHGHGGAAGMRETFAELASHADSWLPERPFRSLPLRYDGKVSAELALLASVCSGMVADFGLRALRSAVAFWATETDPQIWRDVAAA